MWVGPAIAAALAADPSVMALATGGIHDRPLAPDVATTPGHDTPDATPSAFDADGMLAGPALVVLGGVATPDRRGPPGAFRSNPQVWVHTPSDAAGRANGTALAERVVQRFHPLTHRRITLAPSGSATVTVASGQDFVDDPVLPLTLVASIQLTAVGWRPPVT